MSREIDALIEQAIFGNKVRHSKQWVEHMQYMVGNETLKHYSTDIKAAWEVVEKMIPEIHIQLEWLNGWEVGYYSTKDNLFYHLAAHESAPMAFCLAALKSKGVEVKE